MTDRTVIIIPARYASTRFEGKPLAMLTGATGARKSLIQRSWETACDVPCVDGIFVATDDERIADAVYRFGGEVIMTSPTCRNGTERVAEAVQKLPEPADIVVNLQGDAPLTPPWFITALIEEMKGDATVRDGDAGAAVRWAHIEHVSRRSAQWAGRRHNRRLRSKLGCAILLKRSFALYGQNLCSG
jgi:CMP-2-keto-3-deoxyoctulosonic acid synthetase